MSKTDVAKGFQHLYESSNNGEYWGSYFDGATYNRTKDSKLKQNNKKNKMNINIPSISTAGMQITSMWIDECSPINPISFGSKTISPQVCTAPCQKGNNPMYVDNDKHIESSKINYLTDRASYVFYHKQNELPAKFGFQTSKT